VLEAELAEAERDAARGEITAPFAARIAVVDAAAGDQARPNQTILTPILTTAFTCGLRSLAIAGRG
jgi:multidrug resistance efflux pump